MITKEITIHALNEQNEPIEKKVNLAYCYATEIAYKVNADEDISDFMVEVVNALQEKKLPDIQKTIYLILACVIAYYDGKRERQPITDRDIMYTCTSEELGIAIAEIINMRAEFYHIPLGEPEEKQKEDNPEKNA